MIGKERGINPADVIQYLQTQAAGNIPQTHRILAASFMSLHEVLNELPIDLNVNLSILYPSVAEEKKLEMTSLAEVNSFADSILTVVFNHARTTREKHPDFMRSVVFTSYNASICTALNWKQPNCKSPNHHPSVTVFSLEKEVSKTSRLIGPF